MWWNLPSVFSRALASRRFSSNTLAVGEAASASAVLAIVTEPVTGALLIFAVTGMLLYANALQRGDVGPVTAVLWIAEVIAPSAMALLMLGDDVSAQRAYEIGLITRVVPPGQLTEEVTTLAVRLASGPTRALALTKWLVNRSLDGSRASSFEMSSSGR